LLVLVPGALSAGAAAGDPLGLEAAIAEVRAALQDLADALNGAPRLIQTGVSADLHLTGQAIARVLDRLDGDGPPIPDPTLVYDLNLLADIAHAATGELRAIADEPGAGLEPERARRIDRLTEAAASRLAEVNLVIDSANERSRNAVIDVQDQGGVLLIRSTDRLVYDGVRYVSIGLLLVGLLALGLHLLHVGHQRATAGPRAPKAPVLSALGSLALVVFFACCTAFSLRPGTLAALSADVRVQAQEHPCDRMAAQRDRLIAAQQADHAGLIEATEQRMLPAAQDCLGLPSEAVAAEAIERIAAKTALAQDGPAAGGTPVAGLTAAGPDRGSPPEVAKLRPAETEASGDLSELLANLRDTETPVGDPPAAAVEPAEPREAVAQPPSTEPREAAAQPPSEPAPPAPQPIEPALKPIEPAAGPDRTAAPEADPEPAPAKGSAEPEPAIFVATTALNYRDGPSVDARRLGTLFPGARLRVLGEDAGWAQVRLDDGQQAYVATEFLEPVPAATAP
jgi:hypothetical protein